MKDDAELPIIQELIERKSAGWMTGDGISKGEEPSIDALESRTAKEPGQCQGTLHAVPLTKQRCSETLDAIIDFMPAPTDILWLLQVLTKMATK